MLRHPRERRTGGISRREFLRRSAAMGLALPSAAAILAACGGDEGGTAVGGADIGFNLAPREDDPVTLPLYDDNPMIESGLQPETDTVFKIYNWIDYVRPKTVEEFGEKYGVKTEVTTFYNMEQAIEKMRTGDLDVDIFFPTIDYLGRLVAAKLIQPLNGDYLPNTTNLWPNTQSPFYDQESRYSRPYVIYTTGIAYLRQFLDPDEINGMENPYDIYWDPRFKGVVGIYDDYRDGLGMALLRNGFTDLNTGNPQQIETAKNDLVDLVNTQDARLTINGTYAKLPKGVFHLHMAWSGDIIGGQYYTGNGIVVDDFGYWFPEEGGGAINNDLIVIPKSAPNPVLAHEFINYLLDDENGLNNFGWVGYQPPLTSMEPTSLVKDGWVPASVENAIVLKEQFDTNLRYLALQPNVEAIWLDAWEEVTAGGG
jgi:spermidine/putrescine transport system substrate-binding protein